MHMLLLTSINSGYTLELIAMENSGALNPKLGRHVQHAKNYRTLISANSVGNFENIDPY